MKFPALLGTFLFLAPALHADVLYNLVLTPELLNPPYDSLVPPGTGTLLLNIPPPTDPSGPFDPLHTFYGSPADHSSPYVLEALTFNLDGNTFTLASPEAAQADVIFDSLGNLGDQYFYSDIYTPGPKYPTYYYFYDGNGLFNFEQDVNGQPTNVDGYITVSSIETVPSTPTPEPSTLALLGTGLLTTLTGLRRRLGHG